MDPYKTLGVPKDADAKVIKRARQKKARELHPDRNKAAGAADEMARCNLAYDILVDPVRRANYDKTGHARVTPVEEDARKLVVQAFRAHIYDQGPPTNVVRLVINGLEGMLSMGRDEVRELTGKRDRLKARRDELDTDDEHNLWTGIIDGELEGIANQLATNAHGVASVTLALEVVKRYRSRVKESPGLGDAPQPGEITALPGAEGRPVQCLVDHLPRPALGQPLGPVMPPRRPRDPHRTADYGAVVAVSAQEAAAQLVPSARV